MRKPLVIGGAALGAVIAIVVIIVLVVVASLDSIVKAAIEKVGSEATGTTVSVADVDLSIKEGRGTIRGLAVGNPEGFSSPEAFRMGEITLVIDTGSVTGNPIVVREVKVVAPEVTYEMSGAGSNIDAIKKNLDAYAGGGAAASAPADKPEESAEGEAEAKKVVIEKLSITGGTVNLVMGETPLTGDFKTSGKLGDIVMTDIGKEKEGASAAEIAKKIGDVLVQNSMKAAQTMGISDALGGIQDTVRGAVPGDIGGAVKGLFGK